MPWLDPGTGFMVPDFKLIGWKDCGYYLIWVIACTLVSLVDDTNVNAKWSRHRATFFLLKRECSLLNRPTVTEISNFTGKGPY